MNYFKRIVSRIAAKVLESDYPNYRFDVTTFCEKVRKRGFIPKNILDVGANKGTWSERAWKVFPSAHFTLIEPQIEMKPFLDEFCEKHNANWINAGAGAEEGSLPLTVVPDTVSSSFTISGDDAINNSFERRVVPVTTLDAVCRNSIGSIPEMVKLDVEGFEYEVLRGSGTLLGKSELILVELVFIGENLGARKFHELVNFMADVGYKGYDFTSFEFRPYDGALGLCEMAFALDSGILRTHKEWR